MVLNRRADRLLIVDAIGNETPNFIVDLGQQFWNLRGILRMAIGDARRQDATLVIDAKMELFPAPALLVAMFVSMPFALTTDLQPVLSTITDVGPWGASSTCRRIVTVALRRDNVV